MLKRTGIATALVAVALAVLAAVASAHPKTEKVVVTPICVTAMSGDNPGTSTHLTWDNPLSNRTEYVYAELNGDKSDVQKVEPGQQFTFDFESTGDLPASTAHVYFSYDGKNVVDEHYVPVPATVAGTCVTSEQPVPAPTTVPVNNPAPVVAPTPKPRKASVCVRVSANGSIDIKGQSRVHYRTPMPEYVTIRNHGKFVSKMSVQLRPEHGRLVWKNGRHRHQMRTKVFVLRPGGHVTFKVIVVPTAAAYLKNVTLFGVVTTKAMPPHGQKACFSRPDVDRDKHAAFEP